MSWSGLQPPVSDDCPSQPEASGAAVKGKKAAFSYLLAFRPAAAAAGQRGSARPGLEEAPDLNSSPGQC